MDAIEVTDTFEGGFSWARSGHGLLECRSHALLDEDGRIWLVDPFDGAGLDEELERIGGEVAGVLVLLDRHLRDSVKLAERYRARLIVPPGRWRRSSALPSDVEELAETLDRCPFRCAPLVERSRQWQEWALWWPARRILVVPEAVGSAGWYRSRSREPLAVHPLLRVVAPPRALLALDLEAEPELLLLGHGDAITHAVGETIELAVGESRRELAWYALAAPRHAVRWARAVLGIGRAAC